MNEFSVVDPLVYMRDLFPVGILTQQEDSCKTRLERSDSWILEKIEGYA
jgi:hypothetical protein